MGVCIIKNISGGQLTLNGATFNDGESYEITRNERYSWCTDSVLAAISDQTFEIRSTEGPLESITKQISWLLGETVIPYDADGSPLARHKVTKTGWGLQCNAIEFTTSLLDGISNIDKNGDDLGAATIKFYDANGVELTTQQALDASCVKTELFFEPEYDYEIIGGELWQIEVPAQPIRMCLYHPFTGHEFCTGGFNAQFMAAGTCKKMDGRAPKLLPYNATYHTGRMCLVAYHPAGLKHSFQLVVEVFTP